MFCTVPSLPVMVNCPEAKATEPPRSSPLIEVLSRPKISSRNVAKSARVVPASSVVAAAAAIAQTLQEVLGRVDISSEPDVHCP